MRSNRIRFTLAVLLLAGVMAYLFLGDTAVRQMFVLRRVDRHLPILEGALASQAEFSRVKVGRSTGGKFVITGDVLTKESESELKHVIERTQPPAEVIYQIRIVENK